MTNRREQDLLPATGMTLGEARSRLSGYHFSKEALSQGERDILYLAEGLLRLIDSEGNETRTLPVSLPEASQDKISADLRHLTKALHLNGLADGEQGGALGGEYGYGANFENDVFMIHRYCWCERDDCPWCLSCSCDDDAMIYHDASGQVIDADAYYDLLPGERGEEISVPEKKCDYCKGNATPEPNFRHKASGSTVTWYKYVGRGMDVHLRTEWDQIMAECLASLGTKGTS